MTKNVLNPFLAIITALTLVTGTASAKEHFKHQSHSSSSDSCCKSVKKDLHSLNKKLNDIGKLELRLNKLAPHSITQKKVNEAGGTLVLNCPGDYCLTENITGSLLVHADSVCIDLCCHTLDADGRANEG